MQPTTNQLLASCIANLYGSAREQLHQFNRAIQEPKSWASDELCKVVRHLSNDHELLSYVKHMATALPYRLLCEIKPVSESELQPSLRNELQVPLEPFKELVDILMALTWVRHHEKALVLARKGPKAMTLLGQAHNAGIGYDIPLAFELAGMPVPKNWENYRLPDDEEVPSKASVRSRPTLGNCLVHCHNGEYALVSSGDWLYNDLVRVESLESTMTKDLEGMISKNLKPKKSKAQEPSSKDIENLASKYC